MTIININALGVTLGDPLFSDLNLTISKADRLGLVAANGRGKTALLDCLAGKTEPTTGTIAFRLFFKTEHHPDLRGSVCVSKCVPGTV